MHYCGRCYLEVTGMKYVECITVNVDRSWLQIGTVKIALVWQLVGERDTLDVSILH
jgi:hypothetical protein